ncbi:MAG: cupin domain-containing protein [Chloroflexi bacterium]|nr:MAG: cupin domain-containing protein [Chloroflexota bacterium]
MTLTTGAYHSAADWPETEAIPGVFRRVLSCGDQVMVVQFTIRAGAEVPAHTHPHEQVGHVVSGRMRFRIGDEERELAPGDGYSVPGGVTHGAVGVTDVVAIDSFHPVRDDYR